MAIPTKFNLETIQKDIDNAIIHYNLNKIVY